METLIQSLRRKGLKITPQRLAIFKILKDNKSHPCAEEIYLKVREDYPTISLATVYQTLDTLENIGRIRVLNFDKKKTRYDPDLSPHHHLICTRCNKIMDLEQDFSRNFKLPRSFRNRFDVDDFRVVFYGICRGCKKKFKIQKKNSKRKS